MPTQGIVPCVMAQVFISFSSKDGAIAEEVAAWLRVAGIENFFLSADPERGIRAGEEWERRLYNELRACRIFVPLVSANWLASPWCHAELRFARFLGRTILPMRLDSSDSSDIVPELQDITLAIEQAEQARDRLTSEITARLRGRRGIVEPGRALFPGIAAFTEEQAPAFFGRDAEAAALRSRLVERLRFPLSEGPRVVVLTGASGVGKSSLVRAGLIPELRMEPPGGGFLVLGPVNARDGLDDGAESLVSALARSLAKSGEDEALRTALRRVRALLTQPEELGAELRDLLAIRQREAVLLVLDQAEGALEAAPGLAEAIRILLGREPPRVVALLTAREDRAVALQASFGGVLEPLAPLGREGLREAIEGPLRVAGEPLDERLVNALLEDAEGGNDALPLVATMLAEMERSGTEPRFTLERYRALGGLGDAIARIAERAYEAQPEPARIAARPAFVPGLVQLDANGVPRLGRLRESQIPVPAQPVLRDFVRARLLRSLRDASGEPVIEASHEALLRQWPRLAGWIDEARPDLLLRSRAETAAEAWEAVGQPEGSLWRAPDLDQLARYARRNPTSLSPAAQAFLEQSAAAEAALVAAKEATIRRLRQWTRGALFAAGVALSLGGFAGMMAVKARRQEAAAVEARARAEEATVSALAERARAVAASAEAEQARDAALRSADREREAARRAEAAREEARRSERQAVSSRATALALLAERDVAGGGALGLPLAVAAATAVQPGPLPAELREVLHAGIHSRREIAMLGGGDATRFVRLSPSGHRVLTSPGGNDLALWTARGARVAVLPGETEARQRLLLFFAPDDRHLVTVEELRTVRVWDLDTGRQLARLATLPPGVREPARSPGIVGTNAIMGVVFPAHDIAVTVAHDGGHEVFSLTDGARITQLPRAPERDPRVAQWSASEDGRRLVTLSPTGSGAIWDLQDPRAPTVAPLLDTDRLRAAAFFTANGQIMTGGAGPEVSADGSRLLMPGSAGGVLEWDLATARLVAHGGFQGASVQSAVFAAGGRTIALRDADGRARLIRAGTHELVREFSESGERISAFRVSRDGRFIGTVSDDRSARVWDAETGRLVAALRGHTDDVADLVFPERFALVATAGVDGTLRFWDAAGKELLLLRAGARRLESLMVSRDALTALTRDAAGNVQLWDIGDGLSLSDGARGRVAPLRAAAISRDGTRVATVDGSGGAVLWNGHNGDRVAALEGPRGATAQLEHMVFSDDGALLVALEAGGSLRLWDARTGSTREVAPGAARLGRWLSILPGGRRVLVARNGGGAELLDMSTGGLIAVLAGGQSDVRDADSFAVSPDGERILLRADRAAVPLWDATTGAIVAELPGRSARAWGPISAVPLSPFSTDNTQVVTVTDDGVRLWSAIDGREVALLRDERLTRAGRRPSRSATGLGRQHADQERGIPGQAGFLGPMGRGRLLLAFVGTLEVLDPALGRTPVGIVSFSPRPNSTSFAVSADGQRLLTLDMDGRVVLWNASDGELLRELQPRRAASAQGSFSEDGGTVLLRPTGRPAPGVPPYPLRLYSAMNGTDFGSVQVEPQAADRVALSPDGRFLAAAGRDGTVQVFAAQGGARVALLRGAVGRPLELDGLAFSADGRWVLTRTHGEWVRAWPFWPDDGDLVEAAKRAAPRLLDREERRRFGL